MNRTYLCIVARGSVTARRAAAPHKWKSANQGANQAGQNRRQRRARAELLHRRRGPKAPPARIRPTRTIASREKVPHRQLEVLASESPLNTRRRRLGDRLQGERFSRLIPGSLATATNQPSTHRSSRSSG